MAANNDTIPLDRAISSLPGDTADKLRYELVRVQIEQLRFQLDTLRTQVGKYEERLRIVEDAVLKFNTILWLTMGGGLLGIINLVIALFALTKLMGTP